MRSPFIHLLTWLRYFLLSNHHDPNASQALLSSANQDSAEDQPWLLMSIFHVLWDKMLGDDRGTDG